MNEIIEFAHATQRNTQAYYIHLGEPGTAWLRLCISYNTVVALDFWPNSGRTIAAVTATRQRIEYPSRTTTKHLREMGVFEYPIVSEETLHQTIKQALMEIGLGLIGPQWADAQHSRRETAVDTEQAA